MSLTIKERQFYAEQWPHIRDPGWQILNHRSFGSVWWWLELVPGVQEVNGEFIEWSCTAAATHGYNTALFAVKVCRGHLPEGMDSEALDERWWERVPEELQ